jgi:hypothetical protein
MLLGLPRYRRWIVRKFGGRLGNGGFWLPLGISWRADGVGWSGVRSCKSDCWDRKSKGNHREGEGDQETEGTNGNAQQSNVPLNPQDKLVQIQSRYDIST